MGNEDMKKHRRGESGGQDLPIRSPRLSAIRESFGTISGREGPSEKKRKLGGVQKEEREWVENEERIKEDSVRMSRPWVNV